MKIDNVTLSILANFSGFTDSIYVKPGNTLKIITRNKTVMGIAKVPLVFEKEFGIYSITKFLSTLTLLKDPEIQFFDKYFIISDINKTCKFYSATEDTIGTVPALPLTDKTGISFHVSSDNLVKIEKAASILGNSEIMFVGNGDSITLQTAVNNNPTSTSFAINLGNTDKTFKVVLSKENIRILLGNYDVAIYPRFAHFISENIQYFIALEASSTI